MRFCLSPPHRDKSSPWLPSSCLPGQQLKDAERGREGTSSPLAVCVGRVVSGCVSQTEQNLGCVFSPVDVFPPSFTFSAPWKLVFLDLGNFCWPLSVAFGSLSTGSHFCVPQPKATAPAGQPFRPVRASLSGFWKPFPMLPCNL